MENWARLCTAYSKPNLPQPTAAALSLTLSQAQLQTPPQASSQPEREPRLSTQAGSLPKFEPPPLSKIVNLEVCPPMLRGWPSSSPPPPRLLRIAASNRAPCIAAISSGSSPIGDTSRRKTTMNTSYTVTHGTSASAAHKIIAGRVCVTSISVSHALGAGSPANI